MIFVSKLSYGSLIISLGAGSVATLGVNKK